MSAGGRHALITGGGRGIGAAIATALASDGMRITLLGRDRAVLERHAGTLPASAAVQVVVADVGDAPSVTSAFAEARERHGEIEVLVNNAGVASGRPFTKTDEAVWASMIEINLTGTYRCTREVVPAMIEAGRGRIVNIASVAGLVGGSYVSAYTAAKHGVIGLTRALAKELGPKGITVNAVCPGFTESAMLDRTVTAISATTGRSTEAAASALLEGNPLGRFVRPDEVAHVVAWLCRPESDALTGQAIVIDGGQVQH